ncbi:MAG: sigma-70 family RNA polymerase sigma factor [Firmicutes bacterium]|nr:sigma-70 family RNA polymerase sigma factor [Bacillota bacterium]
MRLSVDEAFRRYGDRVFSAAFSICRSREDADDTVQDTFLKYHTQNADYADESHLKAWLLRVAINRARDITGAFWRRNRVSWEDNMNELEFEQPEDRSLFEAVMQLPEKYRIVIHLHYYEEYSIEEISRTVRRSPGTVKSQLNRGRKLLKSILTEDGNHD